MEPINDGEPAAVVIPVYKPVESIDWSQPVPMPKTDQDVS